MREFEVTITSPPGEKKELIVKAENLRDAKRKIKVLESAKFFDPFAKFEFKELV